MTIPIRNIRPEDHQRIIEAMPQWWGGRDLSSSLLKIFFIHFQNTCFLAEENSRLAGFLVGFISQSRKSQAYIQLAGVNPECRRKGFGKELYQRFFAVCRENGVSLVKSCTSPANRLSISFHRGMGFEILPGEDSVDGFPVTNDYLSEGHPKVLFQIKI
ncbi:GNAT family N-acetyltransferase [Desulfospira joergensenii]|uniref:GNAT family N-acetyltransferase n=1 Tax=Desulfospira joergensenii TaxID=53329 RepID=UPI0003B6C2C4